MILAKVNQVKIGVWYTLSNFLIKSIGIITLPIFTRIMLPEDIGLVANIASWLALLVPIATLDLASSVTLAYLDFKENIDEFISSNLFLGSLISLGVSVIIFLNKPFFEEVTLINSESLNIICVYLIFQPALQMFMRKCRISYKYKPVVALSILSSVVASASAIVCVLVFDGKFMARIYGFYLPTIAIYVILYIYLFAKGKKIKIKYWKYALPISVPLIWHGFAGIILNSSDRIMITNINGPEYTALYSVAYSAASVISLLWSSMNQAWSPWAYEKMKNEEYNELKAKSKPYFLLFLFITFLFLSVTPEIILIFGGEKYMEAIYVIPPVMLGYVFLFVYSLYVNIESYYKKQKAIAFSTTLAAIVNVALNFVFIPIYGYIAAAYTTLAGYMLLFLFHYLYVKRLGAVHWYDGKFFVKCISIFAVISAFLSLLYTFYIIRYIIIMCVVLLVFFYHRHSILKMIKTRSFNEFFGE